ncbi:CRISPR-associated endonuclease Cas1 [Clostridium acetireducens DSM 10703]|uniref:CRISPR-associated endonuclease Cas1 n=1 Tax=Clostridium acetireducens DSM 10703 TaxID=1121290 RepID=A0A1E8F1L4_9CLOT|nr:CRISPR-associated endonuclease Cas1 [Clostridium acetireducens DSM 10703]
MLKKYNIKNDKIDYFINKVNYAKEINEIMGIEGAAARIYFQSLTNLIPEPYEFKGRNKNPPKDEVNALLSLTYSILNSIILSEIEKVGLDSFIGFLHGIKYGRESLSLDLLELYRSNFCDDFVLKLLRRKEIRITDFTKNKDGIRLKQNAFRKYIKKFNKNYEKIEEYVVFSDNVYSFLKGKHAKQAVDKINDNIEKYKYFIKCDIKSFFPSINKEIRKLYNR